MKGVWMGWGWGGDGVGRGRGGTMEWVIAAL